MRRASTVFMVGLVGSLSLAACGETAEEAQAPDSAASEETATTPAPMDPSKPAEDAPAMVDASAPPAAVGQCIACHSFERDGPTKIGPNLWGIHGQPAAGKSGYAYSNALREAGVVWDDATLDGYLTNPRTAIPGNKMSFAGMRNAERRAEVIAYLASLTDAE